MTDLLAARAQMAVSLGFHIVFAEIGIAMPVLMVLAEWRWRRTGSEAALTLARRWAKGTAILFAVGAVSGTVLSFELGLLWPRFMALAGPIIGLPFSLEGFAFFTEAIFLGVYLYGWDRVSPRAHILSGIVVAVSGALSALFVVLVNAWMNTPVGYTLAADGRFASIDPVVAMGSPAAMSQAAHMLIAAYASTALAVAGIHAAVLLREPGAPLHREALLVALWVGIPAALLQPMSGDVSARMVARTQPAKLAALEALFTTEAGAPLHIGGWPDTSARKTTWSIEIPGGLSMLAFHDAGAVVSGLDAVPRADWPPVAGVHIAFQLMVGLGTAMAAVACWAIWGVWRGDLDRRRWLLRALAVATPCGFLATEAGWTVTELGRQPWVVQGVLRTSDAVTPMPGLVVPFTLFTLLYIGLAAIVTWLIRAMILSTAPSSRPTHASVGGAPR